MVNIYMVKIIIGPFNGSVEKSLLAHLKGASLGSDYLQVDFICY